MPEYTIDYVPHDYQLQVHNNPARFRLVVAHRRFGKTTLAVNEIIKGALSKKGRYFYVAPYRNQAKMIAWGIFSEFIPQELIKKKNDTELIIELVNGSEIALKGTDQDPDRLRGAGLHGVVLDEYGDMKQDVWPAVIRPMLSDTKGWAIFIGTPKGRNHFHALYSRGEDEGEDIQSFLFPASRTGLIDDQELASAKKDLPERLYVQEYECEWLEGQGSVFRKIDQCIRGEFEEPQPNRMYVMGVDLARLQDFTVLIVMDRHTHHVVAYDRFNDVDWGFQKAKIEALARKYNTAQIKVDATGVGDPIEEDLRKAGLNVEGIRYTSDVKKNLIENLSILIEQREITFPHIPELKRELEAFTYVLSQATKRVRYNAPEGMHDDTVNALALAVHELGARLPAPSPTSPFDPLIGQSTAVYRRPLSRKTGY